MCRQNPQLKVARRRVDPGHGRELLAGPRRNQGDLCDVLGCLLVLELRAQPRSVGKILCAAGGKLVSKQGGATEVWDLVP